MPQLASCPPSCRVHSPTPVIEYRMIMAKPVLGPSCDFDVVLGLGAEEELRPPTVKLRAATTAPR